MKFTIFQAIAVAAMALAAAPADASVVLHGTRVIYPGDARDVTIAAENNGSVPVVVQAWLDAGDPSALPDESPTPFILNPPLFRLDPSHTQDLRLIYTHDPVPTDRESVYWLNVLEIPPKAQPSAENANQLQLIFRSRIKVFFRPPGLPGKPDDAPAKVQWTLGTDATGHAVLKASNPTAYHVTFSRLTADVSGVRYQTEKGGMVAPGTSEAFPLPELKATGGALGDVEYTYLNDYGAGVEGRTGAGSRK